MINTSQLLSIAYTYHPFFTISSFILPIVIHYCISWTNIYTYDPIFRSPWLVIANWLPFPQVFVVGGGMGHEMIEGGRFHGVHQIVGI